MRIGVGFGVMLLKDNKVLLGKRNPDPKKASSLLHGEGTWTMHGGKLKFKEKFEDGAKREVFEETGIKVNNLKVISLSNDVVEDAHFVTIGLLCQDFSGSAKVMEPNQIIKWGWFDLKKLPEPLFFPSKKIIQNYLFKQFYDD